MGCCVIKHTDGNIMPILDQLVQTHPHALHSIDPQAGVDLAEVKRLYGDQVCLIGMSTADCSTLALKSGMPNGGYMPGHPATMEG